MTKCDDKYLIISVKPQEALKTEKGYKYII